MFLTKGSDYGIYLFFVTMVSILLNRYNGHDDIVLGTLTNVKSAVNKQLRDLILPITLNINGLMSIKDIFNMVKKEVQEVLLYKNIHFDTLLKLLGKDYQLDEPVFNTMVFWGDIEKQNDVLLDTLSSVISFDNSSGKKALKIYYQESYYNSDNIKNYLHHLLKIITMAIENPQLLIKDIEIISDNEFDKIVHGFNITERYYDREATIKSLFEKQVKDTPNNIALFYNEKLLTYTELNEKANIIAWTIKKYLKGLNTFVAIMMDRSIELIATIIAVLKAGAAYVPIDPLTLMSSWNLLVMIVMLQYLLQGNQN